MCTCRPAGISAVAEPTGTPNFRIFWPAPMWLTATLWPRGIGSRALSSRAPRRIRAPAAMSRTATATLSWSDSRMTSGAAILPYQPMGCPLGHMPGDQPALRQHDKPEQQQPQGRQHDDDGEGEVHAQVAR